MGEDVDAFLAAYDASQPPSLENPFVGSRHVNKLVDYEYVSQPPSLENPFVGPCLLTGGNQGL